MSQVGTSTAQPLSPPRGLTATLRTLWNRDATWAHLMLLPTYIGLFGLVLGPVIIGFVI